MRASLTALALTASLLAAGCDGAVPPVDLIALDYAAADALIGQAAGRIEQNKPLLFGTFADINAMGRSSALGRTMAEQIASRFAQRGYAVTEVKLRDSLLVDHGGEFILSRDASVIAKTQDARAVVTGTYSMANRKVFVNARVIDAWNGRVLAAHDFVLPMDREIRSLGGSF